MFSVFMISRIRWRSLALVPAVVLPMEACNRVPLLAPSGSTITLTSATTALPDQRHGDDQRAGDRDSGTAPHAARMSPLRRRSARSFRLRRKLIHPARLSFSSGLVLRPARVDQRDIRRGQRPGHRHDQDSGGHRRRWQGSHEREPLARAVARGSVHDQHTGLRRERQRAGRSARVVLDNRGCIEFHACRHGRERGCTGGPEHIDAGGCDRQRGIPRARERPPATGG